MVGRLVFETENELLRFRITEPAADHFFDIDRITPEAFEDFFLLFQFRLGLRQPTSTAFLLLLQSIIFLPRVQKINARRRANHQKEK